MDATKFARYSSRVTQVYYLGARYVVRRDLYPHTTVNDDYTSSVTRQGESYSVGIRQGDACTGEDYTGGYATRWYTRKDRDL